MANIHNLLIVLVVIAYLISTFFFVLARRYTWIGFALHTFKWFCFGALLVYIFGWCGFGVDEFYLRKFPSKLERIPFYSTISRGLKRGNIWNALETLTYTYFFSLGISFSLIVIHFKDTNKWKKVFCWNLMYIILFFVMFSISDADFEWGIFLIILSTPWIANYLWSNTDDKLKTKWNPISKEGCLDYDCFKD